MPEIANMIFSGEEEAKRASARALQGIRSIIDALTHRESDDDREARRLLHQGASELSDAATMMASVDVTELGRPIASAYEDLMHLTRHMAVLAGQQAESNLTYPVVYTLGPLIGDFLFKGATITGMARQAGR